MPTAWLPIPPPSSAPPWSAADGSLIDPDHGVDDLAGRVLRLARFAARFADFTVALETVALMRDMVLSGELDHLVAERVWQEVAKGLMAAKPSRMFSVLRECGALARLLPELDCLYGVPQRADYHPEIDTGEHVMMVIDESAQRGCALPVRVAALLHDLGKGTTPAADLPRHPGHEARSVELVGQVCARLKVPVACRELAVLVARHHGAIHRCRELRAATIVGLLEKTDALRRPARFEQLLEACACDFHGRLGWHEVPYPAPTLFRQALARVQSVDAATIARAGNDPATIAARVHAARVAIVERALLEDRHSIDCQDTGSS